MDTTYTATMPWGEKLTISVDLTQASDNILYGEDGDFKPTPFQTADARHDETEAMMLVVTWLGRGWYRAPDEERDEDAVLTEIRAAISEQLNA